MSLLTIVDSVHHQTAGSQPRSFPCRFERHLGNNEQPWEREQLATADWQPVVPEACWVKGGAVIVLANNEGRFTQKVPEPEEVHAASLKVIELSGGGEPVLVSPGAGVRIEVRDVAKWRVRCVQGARFSLMVIQV